MGLNSRVSSRTYRRIDLTNMVYEKKYQSIASRVADSRQTDANATEHDPHNYVGWRLPWHDKLGRVLQQREATLNRSEKARFMAKRYPLFTQFTQKQPNRGMTRLAFMLGTAYFLYAMFQKSYDSRGKLHEQQAYRLQRHQTYMDSNAFGYKDKLTDIYSAVAEQAP